jgi:purine-nucleoside phosphorylase
VKSERALDLPGRFALDRFGITPADVVRLILGCAPERIHRDVLLTPIWPLDTFLGHADLVETVTPKRVFTLSYDGRPVTVVRSGIGAPMTGDAVLALGCTACARLVFTGSVGGLVSGMTIGDLVLATEAVAGDGFSTYLDPGPLSGASFLSVAAPDPGVTAALDRLAERAAAGEGVSVTRGRVFSGDCLVSQFRHLPAIVGEHGCLGIEMETAAVFRAAALVGIAAGALLQLSDVSADGKSLFAGRTESEQQRKWEVRRRVLPPVVLGALARG